MVKLAFADPQGMLALALILSHNPVVAFLKRMPLDTLWALRIKKNLRTDQVH
jgi:hypothetical protein